MDNENLLLLFIDSHEELLIKWLIDNANQWFEQE